MEIVHEVVKLNSISWAWLNFRRRPVLCTTLYRNPMQSRKFDGTSSKFDRLFLKFPLCEFHRRYLSPFCIPWCKKVKNDKKSNIKLRVLDTLDLCFFFAENEEEGWPLSQKQCSIRASRRAFNYAQGKTDTEANFVVTVGFTTKVDHQTTSKNLARFSKLSDDRPWSLNRR